ncbi:hypothetical protein [Clostridium pasteurianum]|uniref:O-Antigen ligase n=1 Tax=Clostridium pasteurianum BC1 TaxID=86416 RepID=R4K895_CLOPA|nr:hypothetical protein [Clostridium pasteurianum]AGK95860.1 hypothetical protein Clopa_0836 [Clostridium pasteurianum BC1]
MTITLTGIVILPLILIVFIFCDIKYLFYLLFFFSAFTSTALLKFSGSEKSFQIYHVVAIIFIIRIFVELKRRNLSIQNLHSRILFVFIFVCFFSLFYPLIFSGGTIVKTPSSDKYLPISFSSQNSTQFLYLLLGYLTYLSVLAFFKIKGLKANSVLNIIRITLSVILILGIIQFIMPVKAYNNIFRNDFHSNDQIVALGVRISSVTMEASILALFVTPLFIGVIINFFNKFNLLDLVLIMLSIAINLENGSSSFFVGVFIFIGFEIFLSLFVKNKKLSRTKIIIVSSTLLLILVLTIIFKDKFIYILGNITGKLNGQGESGSMRKYDFQYHMNVFKNYLITGIGFGSVRSKDLISTILADVGLCGGIPLIIYISARLYLLKRIGSEFSKILYAIMFVTIAVLFISVPEIFYLYIWIYFGIIDYFLFNNEDNRVKIY